MNQIGINYRYNLSYEITVLKTSYIHDLINNYSSGVNYKKRGHQSDERRSQFGTFSQSYFQNLLLSIRIGPLHDHATCPCQS